MYTLVIRMNIRRSARIGNPYTTLKAHPLSINRTFSRSDWGQLIATTIEHIGIEFSIRIHMPSSAAKTIKYRLRGHLKTPQFPNHLNASVEQKRNKKKE